MTIPELEAKIEHNRIMRDKFIQMRPLLKDKNVISDCETQIKEFQRYIDYFTAELNQLQLINTTPTQNNNKKYSNLDLLMSETPYNKPKVSLKLHELEYKLDVEKTVFKGIKSMLDAMDRYPSSDRKNRFEVQNQLSESQEKSNLLKAAVKKYKNLYIGEGGDEDDYELEVLPAARLAPGLRRPVTGKLQLEILEATELLHAPTRLIRTPDTVVLVKVDGQIVFRSRSARNDKWNELCETHVSKASEIEISIYDQSTDKSLPIGIFWLKITDITEALRKRKAPQWMHAEDAKKIQHNQDGRPIAAMEESSVTLHPELPQNENGIEAWFDVEPVGKLALRLNFLRVDGNRRPVDKLGRAGAVRQRREEVLEINGHQFVEKRFYNVMKCALCEEFFVNSGLQCEDCEYTCHKKCANRVVINCVANSQNTDKDEERLNHKIPHRFEPITNIGANWCCHCGYMLPLGSRSSKKCMECEITAHTACVPKVRDFCGLSMEMANQMLAEIVAANNRPPRQKSDHRRSSKQENGPLEISPPPLPVDDSLNSKFSSSITLTPESPQTPQKSPLIVPKTPPTAYNNQHQPQKNQLQASPQLPVHKPITYTYQQQRPQSSPQQQYQQGYYIPSSTPPISMTQPNRIYYPQQHTSPPQQVRPPQQYFMPQSMPPQFIYPSQQQQRPQQMYPPQVTAPPMRPGQLYPITDPRYKQQQEQQSIYQQHQRPYLPTPSNPNYPIDPHQKPYVRPSELSQKRPKRKIALEDFSFLAVLGKGNFGKVMLAEDKYDSKLYAIKMLKKRFIIDNEEIESVRSEKRIFQAANRARHPFLINLHSTFQTESRVYFVMEYVSGGDLMWHIQRGQFSEKRAKFYACEVLLALEYFHSQSIIYRDLKLDNIMLGLDGHIKIADYGLCKENMSYGQSTGTFCGTPEFMAPEILREQRYGRAVDWWAFGVLVYEMLLGQSPFRGEDEDEIFNAILEDDILYPLNMSSDSISICQQLLQRDPNRRLGGGPDDALSIKRHPFFRNVNWDDMLAKRVPPPFYPSLKDRLDTSNFDEEFTNEAPALTPIASNLNRQEQGQFQNFSYIAEWVHA